MYRQQYMQHSGTCSIAVAHWKHWPQSRPPLPRDYAEKLATRLAAAASIPLDLARKRVQQFGIRPALPPRAARFHVRTLVNTPVLTRARARPK
jgi:hypothetical protein